MNHKPRPLDLEAVAFWCVYIAAIAVVIYRVFFTDGV